MTGAENGRGQESEQSNPCKSRKKLGKRIRRYPKEDSYLDSIFRCGFSEFKIADNKSDKISAHFHGFFKMIKEQTTVLFCRVQERHVGD